eukprot:1861780-Rhodomonas_salina.1
MGALDQASESAVVTVRNRAPREKISEEAGGDRRLGERRRGSAPLFLHILLHTLGGLCGYRDACNARLQLLYDPALTKVVLLPGGLPVQASETH